MENRQGKRGFNMQQLSDRPMLLAVKSHAEDTMEIVGSELAKYLKFPLIDQDEITQILPDSQFIDKVFEIVLQIASIQLKKLMFGGVVIRTPLSQETHFDMLNKQATSAGAILVIIQSLSEADTKDYDSNGVSKFTVDTSKFTVEDFVSDELDKVRKRSYRHLHALVNKPTNESKLHCQQCQNPIQGASYQCILGCKEYIFDKACAELPGDLDQVRKNCPKYLQDTDPEYLFPKELKQNCQLCVDIEGSTKKSEELFSDTCHDCLFRSNIKGKFLPIIVNHESHGHPLNLVMMPRSYNYVFVCSGCGDFGHSISYRCYDCNFNLHVACVLLPRTVSYDFDKHPLRLTYDSLEHNYMVKSYCEACKKERNQEHWFYFCPACESTIHLDCAINQSRRDIS